MATAAVRGRGTTLGIGTTATSVIEIKTLNINYSRELIDVTSNDSETAGDGWREFLAGHRTVELTFNGNYIADNASHKLFTTNLAGTATNRFTMTIPTGGGTNDKTYVFNGFVENFQGSEDFDGSYQMSGTIRASGTVTVPS